MSILHIVTEFPKYKYPGPRFQTLGDQSGEEFRGSCFIPWLKEHLNDNRIVLNIDGFAAYPPSFFKEFILGTADMNHEFKKALQRTEVECKNEKFRQRIQNIIKEIGSLKK